MNGLEMKAIIGETEEDGIKLKSFCRKHSKQKDISDTESESSPKKRNRKVKKELTMSSGERKSNFRYKSDTSEFYNGISVVNIAECLKVDKIIVDFVYQYWKLKRKANFNRPLLMPKIDELNNIGRNEKDYAKMKMFVHWRQDLERGKASSSLRNIHNEQLSKLQAKHQQDVDFLEDFRNFAKIRAAIEKEYGQALLKLATTYLQRKVPNINELKGDETEDQRTAYIVWKCLLDETEKIAKARLAAAEVYQQQVSENAKILRTNKMQLAKKCFDNIKRMQDEIQQCIQELDKTKKLYFEEEHMAHEIRDKAHDAEEKLKKKKGRIFQSISSLQKNSTKFSYRKEACEIQSTKARNDYILALVAANAHQSKYYNNDLPDVLQLLDCDIYEKIKEYIQLISRTELLTCAACQSSFNMVQDQAQMITRQYTLECFLQDNPVLAKTIQYAFEPCDNDTIDKISTEHNAGLCLSKEAKKWAMCIAKETRTLCDTWKEINKIQAQLINGDKIDKISTEHNAGLCLSKEAKKWAMCIAKETRTLCDTWKEINKIQAQLINGDKTSKLKAEARIEALREGEVNVDEWMRTDVEALSLYETGDNLSRTGTISSRGSRKSSQYEQNVDDAASEANDSFYNSDFTDGGGTTETSTSAAGDTSATTIVEGSTVETTPAAWDDAPPSAKWDDVPPSAKWDDVPPSAGWDDVPPSAGWDDVPPSETTDEAEYPETEMPVENEVQSSSMLIRCVALFNYQAANEDELSFVEQEELEIVAEGDGDGWIKARNYIGKEGFIPQNYVEIIDGQQLISSIQPAPASFSSVDYYIPEGEAEVPPPASEKTEETVESAPPQVEVVAASEALEEKKDSYCQALYDYIATCDEELSFCEGQMIKIINKMVHDIDDGWWEGEIDGKIGLFPSLVVEEVRSEEGSITSQKDSYCQALYDYIATCDEELSFCEGQMIKIINKMVHDIDDGWWEGEIDGKIGLFPSLVVEEVRSEEGSITSQEASTPVDSAPPPAYTPPKPQFLTMPAQVILTQPTPEIEEQKPGGITSQTVSVLYHDPDFQLELPKNQQSQYQTQFSASDNDSEASEQEAAATEEIGNYAPLVSSPESPTHGQSNKEKEEEVIPEQVIIITAPDDEPMDNDDDNIPESPVEENEDFSKSTYRSAEEIDFDVGINGNIDSPVKEPESPTEKPKITEKGIIPDEDGSHKDVADKPKEDKNKDKESKTSMTKSNKVEVENSDICSIKEDKTEDSQAVCSSDIKETSDKSIKSEEITQVDSED
ncbi:F-BAR and double SH3 domains protein 2-like [Centruroides sculpturatus]|uniref:F-BAR and double SH3 domains protein 2-like n=1 Tax=Centruroides sculpturatus TaxID=218467 RepID=UPI000C6CC383|nr:F-BAR and double SH3 domains protein 2-like [Centruroides sculpturatus]